MQEATERIPGLTLVVSSIYESDGRIHVDVTGHGPDAETIDQAELRWKADPRIEKVQRLFDGPRGVRFHVRYDGTHSIYPYILRHTPVSLGAINIGGGVEHYTVVGDAEDVQRLIAVLREKGEVDMESVKSLHEVPHEAPVPGVSDLLTMLTDKQLEALLVAYEAGYYRWPRTVSASKLAERLERSSSAFLANLRHAESKVLESMVQRVVDEDPGRVAAIRARFKPEGPAE